MTYDWQSCILYQSRNFYVSLTFVNMTQPHKNRLFRREELCKPYKHNLGHISSQCVTLHVPNMFRAEHLKCEMCVE